jgi:hypothetical protein
MRGSPWKARAPEKKLRELIIMNLEYFCQKYSKVFLPKIISKPPNYLPKSILARSTSVHLVRGLECPRNRVLLNHKNNF